VNTNNLAGLWLDVALSLPVAMYFAVRAMHPADFTAADLLRFHWALPKLIGLGAVSASAMLCMIAASQCLPMALFGLLSYVEPLLLVIVAIFIGESITTERMPTYISIFAAVSVLFLEAFWRRWRVRQKSTRLGISPGGV
jgi:chloramphenicol-sensitive protein RarD